MSEKLAAVLRERPLAGRQAALCSHPSPPPPPAPLPPPAKKHPPLPFPLVFACFFLSLMQCLTVDCCGNGRMVETLFDFLLFMWWTAGAITLTVAKNAADAVGTPESGARQAVVTLSWFSAIFFLMLGCTNAFLTAKLAKAKKLAMAQQQQQLGQGLAVSPFAPAFGGHQYVPPGATVVYAPQQPMAGGVPAGYPGAMAPGQPQQWQQQQPAPVVAGAPAAVAAAATQPPTA